MIVFALGFGCGVALTVIAAALDVRRIRKYDREFWQQEFRWYGSQWKEELERLRAVVAQRSA